jgi:diaminopimelate decarboxylase
LAPGQARAPDGSLTLGGIGADRLAQTYGTPLVVLDLAVVDSAIDELAALGRSSDLEISYAAKAFSNVEFFRHLARAGNVGLDVCSLGELVTAERAGFPAERITLHGSGKTDDELQAAADGRVGYLAVDGIEELERFAGIVRGNGAAIILRLNVGIEAQTHAFVRTGGADTKFGIHARDEAAALTILRENPNLRFAGLHAHIGSQIFQRDAYIATAAALLETGTRVCEAGLGIARIVVGGGFGVRTHPQAPGELLDVEATLAAVHERLQAWAKVRGVPVPQLGIEPGRAIVALAGTTLYRVLAVKHQSLRTFVVVDGGIAENPRPALYGARHHVIPVARPSPDEAEMTLCGRSCENDELGIVGLPRDIRTGDLLAMCATGAYTYSMAGNYNRFPRPAVVAAVDGTHRLLARRERLEDVLRNDADASAQPRPAF